MRVIDIVYIRKEIQDGILKPYIKKECDGREYVYIKNDVGEVISIGTVDELRANNKSKEESAFRRKARYAMRESEYLDQGITQC